MGARYRHLIRIAGRRSRCQSLHWVAGGGGVIGLSVARWYNPAGRCPGCTTATSGKSWVAGIMLAPGWPGEERFVAAEPTVPAALAA